jgi:hypothetical protein
MIKEKVKAAVALIVLVVLTVVLEGGKEGRRRCLPPRSGFV